MCVCHLRVDGENKNWEEVDTSFKSFLKTWSIQKKKFFFFFFLSSISISVCDTHKMDFYLTEGSYLQESLYRKETSKKTLKNYFYS